MEEVSLASTALWPLILSVVSFFTLDLIFIALFKKKYGFQFACRITSLIHSVVSMAAALYVIKISREGVYDSWGMALNPLQPSEPAQVIVISLSAGYFIADTLMMIAIPEMQSFIYFGHHFISLLGCAIPIFAGRYGAVTASSLFWLESTNPHLNGRWLLIRLLKLDKAKSPEQLRIACTKAKKSQPITFALFNTVSKGMLLQYIPARFIYLPIGLYRTFANTTSETNVDVLYVCQASTAALFAFFSFRFFVASVKSELSEGPGSWE